MPKIRILPDRVANQIAAGEVIERPAAVIKELVENALDAGATRIAIEFASGGSALMRVEDNGHGMSREDALLALERHATSKIAEAADLDRLATFGFRGEALPSIGSVARFTLRTRTAENDAATEILVDGGKFIRVGEVGRPVGTTVEVAHLFHPVPARRKFLKSERTEAAHIAQCVRLYALACPKVAFTLVEDGKVVFRSPECATLAERVGEIFGRQAAESLVPIATEEFGLKLSGLIGRPGISRSSRHEMVTFVNGRPVDSRALNYALMEGYHESVPKGRYPVAFVFFECDPAAVDVNVHPAKREVRFRSEAAVRGFVIRSVLETLREVGIEVGSGSPTPRSTSREVFVGKIVPAYPVFSKPETLARPATLNEPAAKSFDENLAVAATKIPTSSPGPKWRLIGGLEGGFSLFETPAGLVILDRRAAHERVWFERLEAQFRSGAVPSQRLLLPVPLQLDPIASVILLDRREFLSAHGFEIAEFGRHFFRVEAVPAWMAPEDAEAFLVDLMGALRDGRLADKNLDLARAELARLAAARAIRLPAAGETEMLALLTDLFRTRSPLTSPAGRPTFIEVSQSELARRFQKT